MAELVRLDRGSFQQVRPRIFEGVVARVHAKGDGLRYSDGEEYRDQEELARIVEQLPGLRVVSYKEPDSENPPGHPEDLIANGADYHEIGIVIGAKIDGDKAVAQIYLHDEGALAAVEDGIKELSLGYRCSLDSERYQRGIIVDHLSVVPRARCGATCALRTDSAQPCGCVAQFVPHDKTTSMQAGEMTIGLSIVLDEKSKAVLDNLKNLSSAENTDDNQAKKDCICNSHAIVHTTEESIMDATEIQKQLDEALSKIAELEGVVGTMKKDAETVELEFNQAKLDLKKAEADLSAKTAEIEAVKADAQVKTDAAKAAKSEEEKKAFDAAVDARVELLADAVKVGVETKVDGQPLSDRAIKVAIVKKVDEMDIEDDRSMDFVNGMYSGAMRRATKAAASMAEVRQTIVENRDTAVENSDPYSVEAKLAEAAAAKQANRWRK